jgi:hypothetical protein
MKLKLLLIAAIACCWGAFPAHVSAQTSISCASQNNQRQYCAADTRGGVTLVRQVSQSPCVQNQTWGFDGRGIWVDRGCRADFRIGNGYPGGGGPGGDTITCESQNNRRNYCKISDPRASVDLVQQLSQASCIRGQSWGNDGQGIWVDRGCRAQFRVTSYSGDGPGWWNSGGGHHPSNQPKNGACFFREANFGGDYFCMARGNLYNVLPRGFDENISSIRIYGNVTVTIYNEANFKSYSAMIRRSVPDLRTVQLQGYNNKNWNNRLSSVRVD